MKSSNLFSVCQGCNALLTCGEDAFKKYSLLKKHEIRVLNLFCEFMIQNGCKVEQMDGYFVGFSIGQIGKEFDLLRFGHDNIINIELKSKLKKSKEENLATICDQMRKNMYYLKFLNMEITIFTFVENDGFYIYDKNQDKAEKIDAKEVASCLLNQISDVNVDPDKLFIPSNYLISPFNSTKKFISGEYFLTNVQRETKDNINIEISKPQTTIFCISADAGTGKTLLIYDIAKEQISNGENVLLIHCGKLNRGHNKLIDKYGWNIKSIRDIPHHETCRDDFNADLIIVDESQRISESQLNAIIEKVIERNIPAIFSYDIHQYLKCNETTDIYEYICSKYPLVTVVKKILTKKIRTNRRMASFIYNLLRIGSCNHDLHYECVSIEYFDDLENVLCYMDYLKNTGWMSIKYTTSSINPDPYDEIYEISDTNAHDVIGQEFKKVVYVMNENFQYNEDNVLMARSSYYSATGMLYQIVTRAVDELKIIVLKNPELYKKLLEIKDMSN